MAGKKGEVGCLSSEIVGGGRSLDSLELLLSEPVRIIYMSLFIRL